MVMALLIGMKDSIVPIDQAGRVVLPKNIREELAIKPGDTLKVSIVGSSVTLTPNRENAGFVRKGKALVFSTATDVTLSQKTVEAILERARSEREADSFASLGNPKRRA